MCFQEQTPLFYQNEDDTRVFKASATGVVTVAEVVRPSIKRRNTMKGTPEMENDKSTITASRATSWKIFDVPLLSRSFRATVGCRCRCYFIVGR